MDLAIQALKLREKQHNERYEELDNELQIIEAAAAKIRQEMISNDEAYMELHKAIKLLSSL